jgi:hemerythrin-like metal-binding protein
MVHTQPDLAEAPMTLAVWSEKYATGIGLIDAQHRRLFQAINRMEEAYRAGTEEAEAQESLAFLARYTLEHFETEEALMQEIGYPMLEFHRKEHAGLMTRILEMKTKLDEGFLTPLHGADFAAHMANFAADWLAHHINEADMGYVQFVKERPLATS